MTVIGIDLGTTNTSAAEDGRPIELSADEAGGRVLPSVVAFPPRGVPIVGAGARRRRAIDAKNTIYSAKRILGRNMFATETRDFQERYPFDLVKTAAGHPAFKTRAGVITPMEISAMVLGAVRGRLVAPATRAVVAIPSGFDAAQRLATIEAAARAGFSSVQVLHEPVAAALAYLHGESSTLRYAAVYDLGGGTFDLAVLDCRIWPPQVIATGGDAYLGGDDVDRALADWVAGDVLREHRWDLRSDAETFDRLVLECELAKMRLSVASETWLELSQIDPAAPEASGRLRLTRDRLDAVCTDLVRRTFQVCDEVLSKSGLKARDVDAVFLSGGTTLLPKIREGVAAYFGKEPRCDVDPVEVVSLGASRARWV